MKRSFLVLLLSLFFIQVFAQKSRISGKVTNNRNEGLAGVTVRIGGAGNGITKTDVEGRFSFNADAGKKYTITLSYVGYKDKTIEEISIAANNTDEVVNVILEEAGKILEDVTVRSSSNRNGTARGETVNALISYQRNTNTVASVISGEAIRRSPDKIPVRY